MTKVLSDIPTPALVLDEAALEWNLSRMIAKATDAQVDLRPHCKTAKSEEIARRATHGHSGAVTVSTLHEAEYFIAHGITDITYAVGIAPQKLAVVAALQTRGATVGIVTDHIDAARAIVAAAHIAEYTVYIEIDPGYHRAGVLPDSDALIAIGSLLHEAPGVTFKGVLAHAGHAYDADSVEAIQGIAEQERASVVKAAERLEASGIPCPVRSVGSTPTMVLGTPLDGVTEIRPGVYMFMDLTMRALGVCACEDIALTVLTTVIGHQPGHILTDAGALALAKDTGIERAGLPYAKYGLVRDDATGEPVEGIGVVNLSQEHGWIAATGDAPFPFERYPIGSRLRIFPQHACHAAAGFDRYYVVKGGDAILAEWGRTHGWELSAEG